MQGFLQELVYVHIHFRHLLEATCEYDFAFGNFSIKHNGERLMVEIRRSSFLYDIWRMLVIFYYVYSFFLLFLVWQLSSLLAIAAATTTTITLRRLPRHHSLTTFAAVVSLPLSPPGIVEAAIIPTADFITTCCLCHDYHFYFLPQLSNKHVGDSIIPTSLQAHSSSHFQSLMNQINASCCCTLEA